MSLYTTANKVVNIDLVRCGTSTQISMCSNINQFIVIFDQHNNQSKIYELYAGKNLTADFFPYNEEVNYKTSITYIYKIVDRKQAEIYQMIFPYKGYMPVHCNIIVLKTINNVHSVLINEHAGLYNYGNTEQYLVRNSDLTVLPCNKALFINGIFEINIRATKNPSNIEYRFLSASEKEQYIPLSVANGNTSVMSTNENVSEWVLSTDYIYKGILSYVATCNKEVHLVDEKHRKYIYNIEHFRPMIPHMVKGVISGTFKYVPRGNHRNIKYVLVPHQIDDTSSSDIVICNSDSSGSESEDNS
jgi:hypothetical protein